MAVASTHLVWSCSRQSLNSKLNVRMGKKGDLSNFECGMAVGTRRFLTEITICHNQGMQQSICESTTYKIVKISTRKAYKWINNNNNDMIKWWGHHGNGIQKSRRDFLVGFTNQLTDHTGFTKADYIPLQLLPVDVLTNTVQCFGHTHMTSYTIMSYTQNCISVFKGHHNLMNSYYGLEHCEASTSSF